MKYGEDREWKMVSYVDRETLIKALTVMANNFEEKYNDPYWRGLAIKSIEITRDFLVDQRNLEDRLG